MSAARSLRFKPASPLKLVCMHVRSHSLQIRVDQKNIANLCEKLEAKERNNKCPNARTIVSACSERCELAIESALETMLARVIAVRLLPSSAWSVRCSNSAC